MIVKPERLVGRDLEWAALARFVERRQRLAVVYGPRRVGKSFLLDALAEAAGGLRYQAITGAPATQLEDFGRSLGEWLGAGRLRLDGWADALGRLSRLETAFVAIDELPYLIETAPELPGILQRYTDEGEGPPLILAGSALSVMAGLVDARAPLYGRASTVVVPGAFKGSDLAALWDLHKNPTAALWVDAVLGGLPGYRPLVPPPGDDRDAWMVDEILAPASPLLDAAEAALAGLPDPSPLRGVYRSILAAIAGGDHTFSAIARVAGMPSGALSRPLAALQAAGLIARIPNPLRSRRDRYELADPHLRFWLGVISPHRSRLRAGAAEEVWANLRETTWPSQILGPRWEAVARDFIAGGGVKGIGEEHGDVIGVTTASDPAKRQSHEVDLVAVRDGEVVAIGEAKLRALGEDDLNRLLRIRELFNAPHATIVLASASGVDLPVSKAGESGAEGIVTVDPLDVYGRI